MASYQALLDTASARLYDVSDSPRIDAEVLLQYAVEHDLAWLIAHNKDPATSAHKQQFEHLIQQREQGQPIAYLTGKKSFWSLELSVNPSVLIPRPDTEILVEQALELIPTDAPLSILDLGTGSGAIALSIAKERPSCKVTAVDLHNQVLATATDNAKYAKLTNVQFINSNWYAQLNTDQYFDLIVSNPPYIDSKDPHLTRGDLRFEPRTALVSGHHGLADLQHIIRQAPKHLKQGGYLLVEHGNQQAAEVAKLFQHYMFFNVSLHNDLNQQPRVTLGQHKA